MAKKQELEITIDDDGHVTIKAIGAQGSECLEWTKAIEDALGVVTDRQKTGDYYVQAPAPEKRIDQQGAS